MIKHISLFSGIGGAEAALDASEVEHTTLWRSEIDPKVDLIYRHFWGSECENVGDVSLIKRQLKTYPLEASQVDLLTGGFPCQPFSRLGARKGMKDIRFIKPFQGILNVIANEQPKFIMLENVMLPKEVIKHVLSEICNLGYEGIATKMCPNKDLGFIQKRKRIYITFWRSDQEAWVPSTESFATRKQVLHLDEDVNTSSPKGNCYAVSEKRVGNLFDGKSVYCVTARGHDAHCSYMTWVKCDKSHTGYRGYTPYELWQLFGWESKSLQFETALDQPGISRSSLYHALGNSWHVGHAAYILRSCPLVSFGKHAIEDGEGYGSLWDGNGA